MTRNQEPLLESVDAFLCALDRGWIAMADDHLAINSKFIGDLRAAFVAASGRQPSSQFFARIDKARSPAAAE